MLAMMAAAIEAITVTSARFERSALDRTRLEADIDAGVARAALGIGDPRSGERWRVDGVPQRFVFNGDAITVSVQDEGGRIDLNAADAAAIKQLLVSAGLSAQEADALGDKILDWRTPVDETDMHRLNGATDGDYEAAGLIYRPRHGPFQSVEELNLVLGMTPALYARVRPALTVYSRSDKVDLSVAPPEVQRAFPASAVDESGATQPEPLQTSGGNAFGREAATDAPAGTVRDVAGLAGHSFAIRVDAEHGRNRLSREIVIAFTDDKRRPFLVEAWH
jgi:general secretion pathway protein K